MNTQHLEGWESKFDKEFRMDSNGDIEFIVPIDPMYSEVSVMKDFIRSILTQQHNKTVMECLEVIPKNTFYPLTADNVEQAIKSLLK